MTLESRSLIHDSLFIDPFVDSLFRFGGVFPAQENLIRMQIRCLALDPLQLNMQGLTVAYICIYKYKSI